MKIRISIAALALLFLSITTHTTRAQGVNLIQNGTFGQITYTGTTVYSGTTTGIMYGQIGPDGPTASGTASGATLTVANWTTGGYNFVYTGTLASAGTQANGANAGVAPQAPGQYNNASGFGTTYLWGPGNGSSNGLTTPPGGGNFIAADGAFEIGAITQTITGLTVGQTYSLTFEWAAAQQQGFSGTTSEWWTVSLGGSTQTTGTYLLASEAFSGWMSETMYFKASGTSEVLSFTAGGTPAGEPPFALLADVSMEVVPDFSNWAVFAGFGGICVILEVARRRRRKPKIPPADTGQAELCRT